MYNSLEGAPRCFFDKQSLAYITGEEGKRAGGILVA